MQRSSILAIALMAAILAFVVVVALKLVGYDDPVVVGGGIAGGVTGALSSLVFKRK